MKINRNAPCPCGSNKKYKHCCLNKIINRKELLSKALMASLGVFMLGGVLFMLSAFNPSQATQTDGVTRVWSEEHSHWHYIPSGASSNTGAAQSVNTTANTTHQSAADSRGRRVWSEEHGHWHYITDDSSSNSSAAGSGSSQSNTTQPGPAPPGKVWSEEHGHWHDVVPSSTR